MTENTAAPPAPGKVLRWVLGARPRTLPAAIVPVVVGTAAAARYHPSGTTEAVPRIDSWWCALFALIVALSLQIGTNYANDYSDGIRGTDDARVGPVRLVAARLAAPESVRSAALLAYGVAGAAGVILVWATSWWLVPIGAASILAGWFYTGGPRPYGYAGFGELFVFVFFGLVATAGTFYVQTLRLGVPVLWCAAVMVGLLATALLLANNLRDIASDTASGKHTLAVRLGRRRAGFAYLFCIAAPFAGALAWSLGALAWPGAPAHRLALLLTLLALPAAVAPARRVASGAEGGALLPVLAATGRLQVVFGVLLAASLLWWFS
ncbi:MAG: 1,4-dihydroxy-2-naphthoate polyprenyltransferase [Acidimicrobiales bacterium]